MIVKASAIFLIVLDFGGTVQAATCGNQASNKCVSMPEPSSIAEIGLYVAVLGAYLIWRRRRHVSAKSTETQSPLR
jgi:hypothetical protein